MLFLTSFRSQKVELRKIAIQQNNYLVGNVKSKCYCVNKGLRSSNCKAC